MIVGAVVVLSAVVMGGSLLVVAGSLPCPPIASFEPDLRPMSTHYDDAPDAVLDSYVRAIEDLPSLRLVDSAPGLLYVDSRPTRHVLHGDFGVVLRLTFEARGGGTVVRCAPMAKAWGPTSRATLFRLEWQLRLRAIEHGARERVAGAGAP